MNQTAEDEVSGPHTDRNKMKGIRFSRRVLLLKGSAYRHLCQTQGPETDVVKIKVSSRKSVIQIPSVNMGHFQFV